jgi:hypothetical protein
MFDNIIVYCILQYLYFESDEHQIFLTCKLNKSQHIAPSKKSSESLSRFILRMIAALACTESSTPPRPRPSTRTAGQGRL